MFQNLNHYGSSTQVFYNLSSCSFGFFSPIMCFEPLAIFLAVLRPFPGSQFPVG